jgi:hypothetical protein
MQKVHRNRRHFGFGDLVRLTIVGWAARQCTGIGEAAGIPGRFIAMPRSAFKPFGVGQWAHDVDADAVLALDAGAVSYTALRALFRIDNQMVPVAQLSTWT